MRYFAAFAIAGFCLVGCTTPSTPVKPLPPEAAAPLVNAGVAQAYGKFCPNLTYAGPTNDELVSELAKDLLAKGWTVGEISASMREFDTHSVTNAYLRSRNLGRGSDRARACPVGEKERAAGSAVGQYLARS